MGATPVSPEEEAQKRLEDWIKQSKVRWQSLVVEKLAQEKPSRYYYGIWTVGYCILNDSKPPDLSGLREILDRIHCHETGWPPWLSLTHEALRPHTEDGTIECWLAETRSGDAAHSDFWRASPQGMLFLLRGYQEDCEPNRRGELKPGTVFDLTIPI